MAAAAPAIETNIMGTVHALAFAEGLPALRRFVNVSSGAVYARVTDLPLETPLPEDGHVAPDGLYPVSKYAAELLVRQTTRDAGLPAISVRLAGVFGPLDRPTAGRVPDGLPKRLLTAAKWGEVLGVSGLDSVGDYLHVRDVAVALTALLRSDTLRFPVYNVAAGRTVTLSELVAMVARLTPRFRVVESAPDRADIVDARPSSAGRNGAYDIARVTADTDWRPGDLEGALESYRDWLATHDA